VEAGEEAESVIGSSYKNRKPPATNLKTHRRRAAEQGEFYQGISRIAPNPADSPYHSPNALVPGENGVNLPSGTLAAGAESRRIK
jgi:hypothetical protein